MMEVQRLSADHWPTFFELNALSPWGHVFNGPEWLASIEALFDGVEIFGVREGDRLVAGLPLRRSEAGGEPGYGGAGVCFPATPYSGVTFGRELLERHPRDSAVYEVGEAVAAALEEYPKVFILNPPEYVDMRPFIARGWTLSVKFDYRIALDEVADVEVLLSPVVKGMVEEADKRDVRLELSSDADLFTRLWRDTYGSEGGFGFEPAVGRQHFTSLLDSGAARFHVCRDEEGYVTCGWLVLQHGRKMYGYGTMSSTGSDALYTWMRYHVLRRYREDGFTEFNWCGANVYRRMEYKKDFNPTLIPFFGVAYARQEAGA